MHKRKNRNKLFRYSVRESNLEVFHMKNFWVKKSTWKMFRINNKNYRMNKKITRINKKKY